MAHRVAFPKVQILTEEQRFPFPPPIFLTEEGLVLSKSVLAAYRGHLTESLKGRETRREGGKLRGSMSLIPQEKK